MHPVREKYRALRILALLLTIIGAIGVLLGISIVLWGAVRLLQASETERAVAALYAIASGGVCGVVGLVVFAIAELIRLLIDVERNQRRQLQEMGQIAVWARESRSAKSS